MKSIIGCDIGITNVQLLMNINHQFSFRHKHEEHYRLRHKDCTNDHWLTWITSERTNIDNHLLEMEREFGNGIMTIFPETQFQWQS